MTGAGAEAQRPALTLSEAATATGKHRNTLRNALDHQRFPNAYRDGSGAWRIPAGDLLAAGFALYAPTVMTDSGAEAKAQPQVEDDVARLRADIADLRQRLAVAEALADERGRQLERLWAMLPAMLPAKASAIRWPWRGRRQDGT